MFFPINFKKTLIIKVFFHINGGLSITLWSQIQINSICNVFFEFNNDALKTFWEFFVQNKWYCWLFSWFNFFWTQKSQKISSCLVQPKMKIWTFWTNSLFQSFDVYPSISCFNVKLFLIWNVQICNRYHSKIVTAWWQY